MIYFQKPKTKHTQERSTVNVERERTLKCYYNQEYIRMTMTRVQGGQSHIPLSSPLIIIFWLLS